MPAGLTPKNGHAHRRSWSEGNPELLPPAAIYVDSFDPFCHELGLNLSPQPQTGAPAEEKNKSTAKRQITIRQKCKTNPGEMHKPPEVLQGQFMLATRPDQARKWNADDTDAADRD